MSLLRNRLRRLREGLVPPPGRERSTSEQHADPAGAEYELPQLEPSLPPTLRDPDLNRVLRDDGYVVIDLLETSEIEALEHVRESIHPGTGGTGWESDFYTGSPDVKRRVHGALQDLFAPAIERHLVDHRSILHNFIMNWPGDSGGLVLHQHSTVVDERFRSVIVWCGVNAATEENGTLHVVPRSHRVQHGPRPERTSSWHDSHEELLLQNHLVSVPVGPGQAIVFDNQLLHCSFANTTDEPRISAAAIVIPNRAEFRYYAPVDDSRVRIHRADPEFFIDNQAGDFEWAEPEGLEFIEERPWSPTTIDAGAVSAVLAGGTCSHAKSAATTGEDP